MNQHNFHIQNSFEEYMTLERSMSQNSIEAYTRDIDKLAFFSETFLKDRNFEEITADELSAFMEWIAKIGMKPRSQARILSAVKQMYRFMMFENLIEDTPAAMLQCPKMGMMLPNVLTVEEIDKIEAAIDLSSDEGERNRAIIETLYSCGLRVSELINLKISDIFSDQSFIKVTGKGDKTRIVPISETALKYINFYIEKMRCHLAINNENKDYLFLNRRGRKLTRVMIFTIVKRLVEIAEIEKNVSPHTFRHSFATHLVEGGADLRAVQEMLGHESIQTTEIYTHLDSSYLRDEILTYHPRSDKRKQILEITDNDDFNNDFFVNNEIEIPAETPHEELGISDENMEDCLTESEPKYAEFYFKDKDIVPQPEKEQLEIEEDYSDNEDFEEEETEKSEDFDNVEDLINDDYFHPSEDVIDDEGFDDVEELLKMNQNLDNEKTE